MSNRTQYEVPAALKDAQQRFEEWRSSRTGRQPIPETFWVLAAELAQQYGVFRTAQVLRLGYNNLKQHMGAEGPLAKPVSASSPAFVELVAPPPQPPCECTIELEGPRGRIRIEWKGTNAPDLSGLSRVLWEPAI